MRIADCGKSTSSIQRRDFRQATYRAVRQGLQKAESVLLEPYYRFRLELPQRLVGHAMTDIEKMSLNLEKMRAKQPY